MNVNVKIMIFVSINKSVFWEIQDKNAFTDTFSFFNSSVVPVYALECVRG